MASMETKSLDSPDEVRTRDKMNVDVVHLGGGSVARFTLEPGWTWEECVKPVAGTETCQAAHLGYVVAGTLHVRAEDGAESDARAGDSYRLAPGHVAWVVGNETFVGVEFESETADTYARG